MSTPSKPQHSREEILRTLSLLIHPGGVTELRVLKATLNRGRGTGVASGYFDSFDKLADAVGQIVSAKGIYIVPNRVDPDLLARRSNRLELNSKDDPTTSDSNIQRRCWLLIDLDPARPSGISSTDAEHDLARVRAEVVREHLRELGWPEPILADSGNGWHLLYRIDLPPDDGGIVKSCLAALATRFDDAAVKVDTSVHNSARIWKLYGTLACKGDPTVERPHRLSRLVEVPPDVTAVPDHLLRALADEAPQPSKHAAKGKSARTSKFDLAQWIRDHLPDAEASKPWQGSGEIWSLPKCPFNPDHVGGSAWIGRVPDGAITAGCHHDSCKHWNWHELRELLDPKANRQRSAAAPVDARDGEESGSDDGEDNNRTRAEMLIALVKDIGRLGQTLKREPFVVLHTGPNVAGLLGGSGGWLRDVLAREFYRKYKCVLTSAGYSDGASMLRGEAIEMPSEPLFLRVAPYKGGVVLDLGTADGAAVIVDGAGWRVESRSPVLFQRTALTGSLPIPVRGGSIESLRELVNVTEASWPLLLGFMVASLIPDMPHPILMLGGMQGTGKSTAARFICGLFDPSDAATRSQPRDTEGWAMSVANSWTTVIDNVSAIPDWWSDAMCKAVTGDGWVRRTLYTNGDVSVLSFRRVIVLTSIDAGALRGDLGERLLLIDLEVIPEDKRRAEKEMDAAYQAAKPGMLGALLDILAAVLGRIDSVRLAKLPRMADFAKVLAAVDEVLGTSSLELYCSQGKRIAGEVVEADAVGEAVAAFISERITWTGSSSGLLKELKNFRPEHPDRDWPGNGRKLRSQLNRLAPALKQQGVVIMFPKPTDKSRKLVLEWTAQTARPPGEQPSQASNADLSRAVGPDAPDDRPSNRPTEVPPSDAPKGDSGRSGGSGGSAPGSSNDNEWGILK